MPMDEHGAAEAAHEGLVLAGIFERPALRQPGWIVQRNFRGGFGHGQAPFLSTARKSKSGFARSGRPGTGAMPVRVRLSLPLLAGGVAGVARGLLVGEELGKLLALLVGGTVTFFGGEAFGLDTRGFGGGAFYGLALRFGFLLDLTLPLALGAFGGDAGALGIALGFVGLQLAHLGADFLELGGARSSGIL